MSDIAPDINKSELEQEIAQRFKSLPKPVQDAINSAGVEEHLRTLANTHKLHLDQWEVLENDVMLTLMGFQEPEDLEQNLRKDLDIDAPTATALATDISQVVFEPIRQELERELDHPEAQAKEVSDVETAGAQTLAAAAAPEVPIVDAQPVVAASAAPVAPAPIAEPSAPPEKKAVRAPVSEVYKAGEPSTARKDVHNDPYREPPA